MVAKVTVSLLAGVLALPLFSSVRLQKVEVDTTDAATVAANGTLRIEGGLGDLNVETWDGPGVKISVARIRYAEDAEKTAIEKQLKEITLAVKQESGATVVTTHFPHREFWAKLLKSRTSAGMEYRIQVPRGTNLTIDHGDGAVVLMDTGGNIDVKAGIGDVVALLSPADGYAIDAHTDAGRVDSDFDGSYHHKHIVGENYVTKGAATHHIKLRLRGGNITIQKTVEFKYS